MWSVSNNLWRRNCIGWGLSFLKFHQECVLFPIKHSRWCSRKPVLRSFGITWQPRMRSCGWCFSSSTGILKLRESTWIRLVVKGDSCNFPSIIQCMGNCAVESRKKVFGFAESGDIRVFPPPPLYSPPPLLTTILPRRADFGGVLEAFCIPPPPPY